MEKKEYKKQLPNAAVKKTLFFAAALLLMCKLNAQLIDKEKIYVGTGLTSYLTANGHGAYYSAHLAIWKNRSMFTAGPCMQKRSGQINGGRISYSYLLAGRPEEDNTEPTFDEVAEGLVQLRFLSYVQYLDQASLGYNRARVETITNPEMQIDWNKVKMSTVEAGAGIEIDIKLKYFSIRNFMTLSVFHHINYIDGMYQERTAPALTFGTGILIPKF